MGAWSPRGRRSCGGGGRDGRLRVAALAGGRAAVRVLGWASPRAGAVGRRRASSRVGSISVQNGGWGEGRRRRRWSACRESDDRHGLASMNGLQLTESVLRAAAAARPTAGLFQRILGEMFGARRRARHVNLPSADGERQSLYLAHAMCTDHDLVARVARARLPYAANMVSGVDAAGCARGAGLPASPAAGSRRLG